MTEQGFAKRAPRITNILMLKGDTEAFTPVLEVLPEMYHDVAPEDLARVTKVLETMGYAEVQTDENGVQSIRITAHGAWLRAGIGE